MDEWRTERLEERRAGIARSSIDREFASLFVPNTASPQFCDNSHLQCAMKRWLSGARSAFDGVTIGANPARILWVIFSPEASDACMKRQILTCSFRSVWLNQTSNVDHQTSKMLHQRVGALSPFSCRVSHVALKLALRLASINTPKFEAMWDTQNPKKQGGDGGAATIEGKNDKPIYRNESGDRRGDRFPHVDHGCHGPRVGEFLLPTSSFWLAWFHS